MTQDETVSQRLGALETRVSALENDRVLGPASTTDATFWVLETLRTAPEPAIVYAGTVSLPGGGAAEWQMGRESADLVGSDWAAAVQTLSALAHPARLSILRAVLRAEGRTAAELTALEDMGTTGQVYHHLRLLVAAGWLRSGARGAHDVPVERVVPLLTILAAAGL